MKKRILIIGAGVGAASAARVARDMGVNVCEQAVMSAPAGEELLEIAKTTHSDGILPAPEPAVLAVAYAAAQLELPGMAPEIAERLCDKSLMRHALDTAGIPNPKFRVARALEEATASAHELDLPLVVKPADSIGAVGARRLEYIEDLPLLFSQAYRLSSNKAVLLETALDGPEFCIDAIVRNHEFTVTGITGKIKSAPPCCYDTCIFTPPNKWGQSPISGPARSLLDGPEIGDCPHLFRLAQEAARALEIADGAISIDVSFSTDGPRIIDIAPYPSPMRTPFDITAVAMNNSARCVMANAIRFALGDTPVLGSLDQAAALCWMPARSGIVKGIEGLETARAMPGVREIHVGLKAGDKVGHVTDCPSRDRIGYVLTTGETADDAIGKARQAMEICRISISPTL